MKESNKGMAREFFDFMMQTKKWWMIPILVVLLFLGTLIMLTANPVSVMIYALF